MCRDYKVHRVRGVDPKTAQGGGGCERRGGNYGYEVEAERHPGSWPCESEGNMEGVFCVYLGDQKQKLIGDCELYIQ